MSSLIEIDCWHCGKPFKAKGQYNKYCSRCSQRIERPKAGYSGRHKVAKAVRADD